MKRSPAFTLIEILIATALIGLVTIGGITAMLTAKNNQDLTHSTDHLVDTFRRAHVFSRDSKDSQQWGVESLQTNSYRIISREDDQALPHSFAAYTLPSSVHFTSSFQLWFGQGTGEIDTPIVQVLENTNGQKTQITVEKTGVISWEPKE